MLFQTPLTLLCVLALVAPGQIVSNPAAQEKVAEAQEAFKSQDFEAASAALEAAYLIEPAPALLYPWAQAQRQLGNCEAAVELYQRFLDSGPEDELAALAQENLDRCKEQIDDSDMVVVDDDGGEEAAESTDEDEAVEEEDIDEDALLSNEENSPPEPEPAPLTSSHDDEQPKAKKWYADPAGGVLTGLGVAGVVAGGALLGIASSKAKKVADASTHSDYLSARDGATKLHNGGIAALAIGSTLLLAGIIRYGVVAKKNKRATASVWFDERRGIAGLTISGRF